jgi:hypothetical protein
MTRGVSSRLLAGKARVPSRASPSEICGEKCGTGTGSFPSTSIFSCQYQSTSAPYAFSSTCYSDLKDTNKRSLDLSKILGGGGPIQWVQILTKNSIREK